MTTGSEIDAVERSVEKMNVWLGELAGDMEGAGRPEAYRVLRAVLHNLRDRLTVDESAQLAAQLPMLVRGIYYEGWDPSRVPAPYHSADEFLKRVAVEAHLAGETEASYAVAAVARLLGSHVSAGEIEDVLLVLPQPIRALFAEAEGVES